MPVISELKLRASYGLSGNNAFTTNYPAIGVLGKDNYVLGNDLANGLATSSYRQSINWVGKRAAKPTSALIWACFRTVSCSR